MIAPMIQRLDRRLWLSFALYLLALLLKLPGLNSLDIRPDETKWMNRSARVISAWNEHPLASTTHLGHPGVPPAVLMALGQAAAREWNLHVVPRFSFLAPIDRLLASRLAIVFVASMLIPLVYLGSLHLLGEKISLLAAALLALDPRLNGFSRIAHLDAVLAVFVFACISFYVWSEKKDSHLLKLLAGVFWGLALLTKPTAATLLIGFVTYRLYSLLVVTPRRSRDWRNLVTLGDVGAILVGHLTFAALYTRVWTHNSDYRIRLGIVSQAADYIYSIGMTLQQHYWLVALLLILTLCFAYGVLRRFQFSRSGNSHLGMLPLLTCLALLLAGLTAFPQVYENIIRFWTWTAGLSGEIHRAYGHDWDAEPAGYLLLLLTRLPELTLAGIVLGLFYLVKRLLVEKEKFSAATLTIHSLCAFFWMLILNTSSKQTWRYASPTLPSLYLLASYGWVQLVNTMSAAKWPILRRFRSAWLLVLLLFAQSLSFISYQPAYDLYLNSLSRWIEAKATIPHGAPLLGQQTILNFLMKQAAQQDETVYVATVGDTDIWYHQEARMFGALGRKVQFGLFPLEATDYLLTNPDLKPDLIKSELALVMNKAPELRIVFKGEVLAELYQLPYQNYSLPQKFVASKARHHTGKVAKNREGQLTLYALAGRDAPASVLFHEGFRVLPGKYNFAANLRISRRHQGSVAENASVVRLEFGSCTKELFAREFDRDEFRQFDISCEIHQPSKLSPRIFWPAIVSVEVLDYQFKQLN